MIRILSLCILLCSFQFAIAGKISGTVLDVKGAPLSFASIVVKGTSKGAVANSLGKYVLQLDPGSYTVICQHVGYRSEEKTITVTAADLVLDFRLNMQELTMEEVVIKRGEDPAIEIIRQTIRKRNYYRNQVDSFSVEVYIKGLLRSRGMPDRFMGQSIEKDDMASEGLDSAGKGIMFLSESVTKVSQAGPDKTKMEVLSSRQSGGGYGISFPFFIDFYNNNVSVFSGTLNPRGFISPISDNAFHYYKFRYEGNFFEGSRMIDRIRVTPRRKNEPLFDGYLQIVDGEWRIHSLDLTTTNQYQLELIDTLKITQLHAPVAADIWRTGNQVVYLAVNKFGFDFAGNFLNVYRNYDLAPAFPKKYFDRIVMSYDSTADRKDSSYWSNIRPVPLEPDEKRDYTFKDSVSRMERDSFSQARADSLRKNQKPLSLKGFIWSGASRQFYGRSGSSTYHFNPILRKLQYNTVEGLAITVDQTLDLKPRKGKHNYFLNWNTRYGLANAHLNSFLSLRMQGESDRLRNQEFTIAGGKRVSQFNRENPVDPLTNSLYTLLAKKNYLKIYENWFGSIGYSNRFENGLRWAAGVLYEDRLPLTNAADFSFFKEDRPLLPNHPYELSHISFKRHQALVASVTVSYQPGQFYIQYPKRKVAIGSQYPTFEIQYSKGIRSLAGSDVDFDKWKFSVYDDMNFKMAGLLKYRISAGGFLNDRRVQIPDFQHFNGNQTFYNFNYLNSFQLAPYYRYSNTEALYGVLHAEHHFNGLLTNKIPLFNKLKWNLVAGTNIFYVNRQNYYVEAFAGLENIFKFFRVDFVSAYQAAPGRSFGVRIGFGGILGGAIRFSE